MPKLFRVLSLLRIQTLVHSTISPPVPSDKPDSASPASPKTSAPITSKELEYTRLMRSLIS
ncbi:MAG: hypothetical protein V7K38_05590 [Nostoc sp.]